MSEKLQLDETRISQAEDQRRQAHFPQALSLLREAETFSPSQVPRLSEFEQKIFLEALRIIELSQLGRAKSAWTAPHAAAHFTQARDTIVSKYRNADVAQLAAQYETNNSGAGYDFDAEMLGDEAKYTLAVAGLIGNPEVLAMAVQLLDQAVQRAQEVTGKTLAEFNKARFVQHTSPNLENFVHLSATFQQSTAAAHQAGNWERMATISAWYTIESVKALQLPATLQGLGAFFRATHADRPLNLILLKEIWKELTGSLRNWLWQRTKGDQDYSSLILPPSTKP